MKTTEKTAWLLLAPILLGVAVVFLHGVISCMGGFAFAKLRFRWRRGLYFGLIVLMMMPVQVTLVPSYIILDRLGLLDTWAALALPAIFSPFGTVLMAQVFRSVPTDILDAARVDGAHLWQVLWRIASGPVERRTDRKASQQNHLVESVYDWRRHRPAPFFIGRISFIHAEHSCTHAESVDFF